MSDVSGSRFLVHLGRIERELAELLDAMRIEFKGHHDSLVDSEQGKRERALITRLALAGSIINDAVNEWRNRNG